MVKIHKHITKLFLVILQFALVSCDISTEPQTVADPGITVYELNISNEDLGMFVSNVFSDFSVSGVLNVNKESYKVKIEHHGNSSRSRFKKNYSLTFEKRDPLLNLKKVVLSGQPTDPSALKSYLATEIYKCAGLKTFNMLPVVFYLNGESLGLYYLMEPINEEFFVKRGIKVGELYKAINGEAKFSFKHNKEIRNGFEKRIPKDDSYYSLEQLIILIDNEAENTFPEKVENMMNVDKYLEYMAVSVFICNWDGIVHNFYLYKDQNTGRYEILPWDLDFTFVLENNLTAFPGNSDLMKKLLRIQKYRDKYKQLFYEYLEGCFSISNLTMNIDDMKLVISKAYSQDRWLQESGYDLNIESEKIKEFIKQRHVYIKEQLNNFS